MRPASVSSPVPPKRPRSATSRVQLIATGRAASLAEARAIIDRSFPTEIFEPRDPDPWNREAARFQQYCELAYA